MELFRICMMDASIEKMGRLYEEIKRQIQAIHSQQYRKEIHFSLQPFVLICDTLQPRFQLGKEGKLIFHKVSQAVAEFVLTELEPEIMRRLIRASYPDYDQHEVQTIVQYCRDLIDQCGPEQENVDSRSRRKQKLAASIEGYLLKETILNIHGFILFRVPSYKEELREVVEYAVEEFVMDRQYQEFISLLQYFVYVQDTKVAEVHIIHKDANDFIVLNEQLQPVESKRSGGIVVEMLDKDMNYEDMIISTLITISPQKVFIHTRKKNTQVIKTIQQIFESRTVICEDCHICHPLLSKFSP